MRAASGSAVLINPTDGFLEIHAAHGLTAEATALRLRVGEGITGWVARTGMPARVGDVTKDPRYVMLRPEVRSELAIPLEVNGQVRGVLNVDADRLDAFTAEDQSLFEALAAQAARVVHNTWLYEQLRLKARLFESLASVSQIINSTLNLDDALKVITREACVLMQAKMCSLMLLTTPGNGSICGPAMAPVKPICANPASVWKKLCWGSSSAGKSRSKSPMFRPQPVTKMWRWRAAKAWSRCSVCRSFMLDR